jgi:hypothetical protein
VLSWTGQVLHEVLHIYPPERPTTSFYAPESPAVINNMRKAEAFRNRQVISSILIVGSMNSLELSSASLPCFSGLPKH